MSATTEYTPELIERFYAKVSTVPTEQGCLEWMAYRDPLGYGGFNVGGKCVKAYRVAWEIVNGPIPAGLVVRHMCHNPQCVNPAHLLTGTQADNIHDMIRSGRFQNAPNTYVRPVKVKPTREERFYAKVSKTPTDTGCLEWTGVCNDKGYGRFTSGRNHQWFAHRFAWELVNGPIPDGMVIAHRCDNPRCCRIEHLFCCTQAENMHDMVAKGRHVSYPHKGERNSNAKVGTEQVLEIRSDLYSDWTLSEIAAHFGIGKSQVSNILNRTSWPHVEADRDAPYESGPVKGERHPGAKLTEQDVISIRSDLYIGWTFTAIGKQFGISRRQVSDILHRKRWTHI